MNESKIQARTGQFEGMLSRDVFKARFFESYADPHFDSVRLQLDAVEQVAWDGYINSRKAPRTRKAGSEFADPDYDLSVDWLAARARIQAAIARQRDPQSPSRILLICGSPRNDGSCPGEISKSFRLSELARQMLTDDNTEVDFLDLSVLTSDYGRIIYPCKGCVSTAMPLCHWPCSCYPNHALNQTHDWMNDIYERWAAAHAVMIITPVHWFQTTSPLKLMIDRLVCADGGNDDPTTTSGKNLKKAKALELEGWDYPKHLANRTYSVVVHGDVAGIETVKHALCDWLDWMGLIGAGATAKLDRYIGYYQPYALSHDALDNDACIQQEVRNAAAALVQATALLREGKLSKPDADIRHPRPK